MIKFAMNVVSVCIVRSPDIQNCMWANISSGLTLALISLEACMVMMKTQPMARDGELGGTQREL